MKSDHKFGSLHELNVHCSCVCLTEISEHTKVRRHARAGEDVVRGQLEIKVLSSEKAVHETNELKNELILTKIITQLEHHLGGGRQLNITTHTHTKLQNGTCMSKVPCVKSYMHMYMKFTSFDSQQHMHHINGN